MTQLPDNQALKVCPACGKRAKSPIANFCRYCGAKLSPTCIHCHMKQGQPYNCGFQKCPGGQLHEIEARLERQIKDSESQ